MSFPSSRAQAGKEEEERNKQSIKKMLSSQHPYYPRDINLPKYVPNTLSHTTLISIIFGWGIFIAIVTNSLVAFLWPVASRRRRYTSVWYVLCGFLHVVFEGYFVRNHKEISGQQTVLAQLWKEYTLSDSRYLTGDNKVLCLEFITVFIWGPLSFLTAYWTASNDTRRLVLQTIVNIAHMYGCTLYYATSLVDLWWWQQPEGGKGAIMHSRPEAQYFWLYFIGFNAPFIVVPGYLIYKALGDAMNIQAKLRLKVS